VAGVSRLKHSATLKLAAQLPKAYLEQDELPRESMEEVLSRHSEGASGRDRSAVDPDGLAAWVHKLAESGMPVFAHTARDISRISASEDSSAAELARVVLQDAAMTAKLLRVANSPVFNPMGRSISTVSRAVVVLGFQEVRSICLSIAVVESVLKGKQKQRVIEEMARSFHAAVQARSFARQRKDQSAEEIFIATLLYHLGDMAFWAFAGESAQRLDSAMQQNPERNSDSVQREVLGFPLRELTLGLCREWGLGELLEQSLSGKSDENPRVGNVVLGHELALAAEKGWHAPGVRRLLDRLAETLYLPVEEVTRLVQKNAEEAADTASFYGAVKAGRLIPVAGEGKDEPVAAAGESIAAPVFADPDPMLQLKILRELSTLMESRPDFNLVLEMVLEGIYRGIGMDRALFALRTPDHRSLVGRYALGHNSEGLCRQFYFETAEQQAELFSQVIASKRAVWVGAPGQNGMEALLTPRIHEIAKGSGFFVTPIEIRDKVIGVFYADRQVSGRPLDEESFGSFKHFAQQGNLALTYLN
jgi:HD-like signal output (HDOD) protein